MSIVVDDCRTKERTILIDFISWCIFHYVNHHKHIECHTHYNDVIISAMASEITSLTIVYSTVYSLMALM